MLKKLWREELEMPQTGQTGSSGGYEDCQTIQYPFDKYIIKVKLSLKNEFIGIEEIIINKEFVSYVQQNRVRGFHDTDGFYPD